MLADAHAVLARAHLAQIDGTDLPLLFFRIPKQWPLRDRLPGFVFQPGPVRIVFLVGRFFRRRVGSQQRLQRRQRATEQVAVADKFGRDRILLLSSRQSVEIQRFGSDRRLPVTEEEPLLGQVDNGDIGKEEEIASGQPKEEDEFEWLPLKGSEQAGFGIVVRSVMQFGQPVLAPAELQVEPTHDPTGRGGRNELDVIRHFPPVEQVF